MVVSNTAGNHKRSNLMRKDNGGVSEHAKHTRKRTGLRRRVNKADRRNTKTALRKDTGN